MRKFALLVGVETYSDPKITPLKFANADVIAMADRLRSVCEFDMVKVLAQGGDAPPDFLDVDRSMGELAHEIREEDLLLFYFAGHGMEADGQRYLLTRDCPLAHPVRGLAMAQLQSWLGRVDARERVLLLDACRNDPRDGRGEAGNCMTDALARDIKAVAASHPRVGGTFVTASLSACKAGQRAYEWDGKGHGVFTHFLLQGMDGPAWRGGDLEFRTLANYTSEQVIRWSGKESSHVQEPWYTEEGGAIPIILARRAVVEVAPAPAPDAIIPNEELPRIREEVRLDLESRTKSATDQETQRRQDRLTHLQQQLADQLAKPDYEAADRTLRTLLVLCPEDANLQRQHQEIAEQLKKVKNSELLTKSATMTSVLNFNLDPGVADAIAKLTGTAPAAHKQYEEARRKRTAADLRLRNKQIIAGILLLLAIALGTLGIIRYRTHPGLPDGWATADHADLARSCLEIAKTTLHGNKDWEQFADEKIAEAQAKLAAFTIAMEGGVSSQLWKEAEARDDFAAARATADSIYGSSKDDAYVAIAGAMAKSGGIAGAKAIAAGLSYDANMDAYFAIEQAQLDAGDLDGAKITAASVQGLKTDQANAALAAGQIRAAITASELPQARTLADAITDPMTKLAAYIAIAQAQSKGGNTADAQQLFALAKSVAEGISTTADQVAGFMKVAQAQSADGDTDAARITIAAAKAAADPVSWQGTFKSQSYFEIAQTQAAMNDIDAAKSTADAITDTHWKAKAYAAIATAQAASDPTAAKASLDIAKTAAEDEYLTDKWDTASSIAQAEASINDLAGINAWLTTLKDPVLRSAAYTGAALGLSSNSADSARQK